MNINKHPWAVWPPFSIPEQGRVLVLGAGIAGCSTAFGLARRGVRVDLFDREPGPGLRASGNPAAVILPVIHRKPSPFSQFYRLAFNSALAAIDRFQKQGRDLGWRQTGVVHLLTSERMEAVHRLLVEGAIPSDQAQPLNPKEKRRLTGIDDGLPAILYPRGGHLKPRLFCRAFADHPNIRRHWNQNVERVEFRDGLWRLMAGKRSLAEGHALVLAHAQGALRMEQTAWLPLHAVRGQLSLIDQRLVAPPSVETVVCYKGFLVPGVAGDTMLGASWRRRAEDGLDLEEHRQLIEQAASWHPGFRFPTLPPLRGRTEFRVKTPDYLPLVGPAPDLPGFLAAYDDLHYGNPYHPFPEGVYLPGLFLALGMGSRGMTAAPLAGDWLAARICGEAGDLPDAVTRNLNPARMIVRELRKSPQDRSYPWAKNPPC